MYLPLDANVQTKPGCQESSGSQQRVKQRPTQASLLPSKGKTWLTRLPSSKGANSTGLCARSSARLQATSCSEEQDSKDKAASAAIVQPASVQLSSSGIVQHTPHGIAQSASSNIAQQLTKSWHNLALRQPQWSHQFVIAALLLALPTGVSALAFQAIATPPQPQCHHPKQFQADLAELQCLRQAMQSEEHPAIIRSLQELQNWSSESPVYGLSQRLLEDWSVVALSLADQEFEAGRWDNAARLAAAIPTSLELGNQAKERLSLWETVQNQGEKVHKLALKALEQQDWQTARNHAHTLANLSNDYWRQQGIQALPEQIELARQAQKVPADAQRSASAGLLPQSHGKPGRLPRPAGQLPRKLASRFALRPLSLNDLTVVDPSQMAPEFSATV